MVSNYLFQGLTDLQILDKPTGHDVRAEIRIDDLGERYEHVLLRVIHGGHGGASWRIKPNDNSLQKTETRTAPRGASAGRFPNEEKLTTGRRWPRHASTAPAGAVRRGEPPVRHRGKSSSVCWEREIVRAGTKPQSSSVRRTWTREEEIRRGEGEALHLSGLVAALCGGAAERAARERRRARGGGSASPTGQRLLALTWCLSVAFRGGHKLMRWDRGGGERRGSTASLSRCRKIAKQGGRSSPPPTKSRPGGREG